MCDFVHQGIESDRRPNKVRVYQTNRGDNRCSMRSDAFRGVKVGSLCIVTALESDFGLVVSQCVDCITT